MNGWQEIYRFQTPNFVVTGAIAPEDTDPADSFDDCCQDAIDEIREGSMDWFIARVQVKTIGGEVLGEDYLGACAYKDASEFFNEHIRGAAYAREMKAKGVLCGSYFPDMVREAIKHARSNARNLCRVVCSLKH